MAHNSTTNMAEMTVGIPIQLNVNTNPKIDVRGFIVIQIPADSGAEMYENKQSNSNKPIVDTAAVFMLYFVILFTTMQYISVI